MERPVKEGDADDRNRKRLPDGHRRRPRPLRRRRPGRPRRTRDRRPAGLRRARDARGPRYDFASAGGANIDPRRDRHMHSAWLELVGADEIRNEWTEHADGKTVLVVKSHLVRKAR